jgi:hypothetical protein
MGAISLITTGEQTVSATGAVTGSLATAALTGNFTVKIRVRGLTSAQSVQIALEDTANVTPFSDATQPFVASFAGVAEPEGAQRSVRSYEIPNCRFGVTNSALRLNVQSLIGAPTFQVEGWIEQ